MSNTTESSSNTLFSDLTNRRIPQIMGLYIAGSWTVIQFMDWIVNRYLLSPHLVDLIFSASFSMIPSIFIIAYFHGTPGKDEWTKIEKVGIPINVCFSFILLFVMFSPKDLGAATTEVEFENEQGELISRVIPKAEFRKKIALFFFSNSNEDEYNWLQLGIPSLISHDLSQDTFLSIKGLRRFVGKIWDADYGTYSKLPLGLKKDIAKQHYCDFIIDGKFEKIDETINIKIQIHNSKNGKLIEELEYSGDDVYKLVDTISADIKYSLDIPSRHIENIVDLPIKDMSTTQLDVLHYYYKGFNARIDNKFDEAKIQYEKSVELDPTFAIGWDALIGIYNDIGGESNIENIEHAKSMLMQHIYKLSESNQYKRKVQHYNFIDGEKAFTIAKIWTKLYPFDINAFESLARIYSLRGDAIESANQYVYILGYIDNSMTHLYKNIGDSFSQGMEYEEAIINYEKYITFYPDISTGYIALADNYLVITEYKKAIENYETAIAIDGTDINQEMSLLMVEVFSGKLTLEEYETNLLIKLSTVDSAGDSITVLGNLTRPALIGGQLENVNHYNDLSIELMSTYWSPAQIAMQKFEPLVMLWSMVDSNQKNLYEIKLNNLFGQMPHPWGDFFKTFFNDVTKYANMEKDEINMEEKLKFREGIIVANKLIEKMGIQQLFQATKSVEPIALYFEDKPLKAIELILNENPNIDQGVYIASAEVYYILGKLFRETGDYKNSLKYFDKQLKINTWTANALFEKGKTYAKMNKYSDAIREVKEALAIWENADEYFLAAQKARTKLAEWQKGIN